MIKKITLLFTLVTAMFAVEAAKPPVDLATENADLKAEIKLLLAQRAYYQTELNICSNPDVMQVRLNVALEAKKVEDKAKAKEGATATKTESK